MTGNELWEWRLARSYSRQQLAQLLGTTEVSLYRWEVGDRKVPRQVDLLCCLYEIYSNIQLVKRKFHFSLD